MKDITYQEYIKAKKTIKRYEDKNGHTINYIIQAVPNYTEEQQEEFKRAFECWKNEDAHNCPVPIEDLIYAPFVKSKQENKHPTIDIEIGKSFLDDNGHELVVINRDDLADLVKESNKS